MSAFTLFAFTFWFTLRLIFPEKKTGLAQGNQLRTWSVLFFIVLIIQIIYGAFTAGFVEGEDAHIRPGHIYNTWPKMGDAWIPDQVSAKDGFLTNILENAAGIQFMHRTIALAVVLLICIIWYRSNKMNLTSQQQFGVTLLIYGVTVQFFLGVLTLLYNVPVVLGALHQTGAFFLFGAGIFLIYHLFNPQTTDLGRSEPE
jgi:cytochrome c oxidase assembly protein subunit 15